MPQPTSQAQHLDAALTNVSVAYIQMQDHFISGRVFPRVPVVKQSGKYWSYTKADWFRDEAEKRADGTESAGSGYGVSSTNTYFCDVTAFHKDVGSQARANADAPLDPDRDATLFVSQRLLLRSELQWVTEYFSTGVWGTTSTPSNLWSSYTTSDPIDDIEAGKETILGNTGFEPNTLVVGYKVWRQLKHHPDIVDRHKHVSSGSITTDMVAQLLELDRILVSKSIKNTAQEAATASYSFTAGLDALLCYVNPSPGLLAPSAGYNFIWTGVSGGLGTEVAISNFPLDKEKADRIEGEIAFDYKVIGSDLGYFFNGAVST
jgi:hypothetical protein